MRTISTFSIIKEVEKATLFNAFLEELTEEKEFWLPNSKFEIVDDQLEIDDDFWKDKLEEFQNPTKEDEVILYVENFEEAEKSYKVFLSAKLQDMKIKPLLFLPKSIVSEPKKIDTEDEENYCFLIPSWFWEKTLPDVIEKQLSFFNQDREAELLTKSDFKLLNKIEE